MLSEQDRRTLEAAGINIEEIAAAAAAFIRAHPIYSVQPMPNALSEQEEAFLRQGGAAGIGTCDKDSVAENVTILAAEYAQMVATAYSQREVAKNLGVSTSRVRQRLDGGSLYAVESPAGRVCPRFQFSDHGTLPALEAVLAAISKDAHPVAVQRFFLTVSPDLESETANGALCPRDWLRTGHAPEAVIMLAREL